jgi:hypothetical protein
MCVLIASPHTAVCVSSGSSVAGEARTYAGDLYVSRLLHASYTPLTRLLHASYTPLTRLLHASSVLYTPLTARTCVCMSYPSSVLYSY